MRKNRNHPDHSTIKISPDTQKCPGVLKRIAITQIELKKQLKLE